MENDQARKDYWGHVLPVFIELESSDYGFKGRSCVADRLRRNPLQLFRERYSKDVVDSYNPRYIHMLDQTAQELNGLRDPLEFTTSDVIIPLQRLCYLTTGGTL